MYLKEFRERVGLSQKEIAEKLDVDKTNIGRYERDEVKPTSTAIEKYINVFNANPNYLFLGIEPHILDEISNGDRETNSEINSLVNELNILMSQDDLTMRLRRMLLEEILKKFDNPSTNIVLKILNVSGPNRPILFMYYISRLIEKNLNDDIKDYKIFLIDIVEKFSLWNLIINQPIFTKKIKKEIIETIQYKIEDNECKLLIDNNKEIISIVEEQMPLNVLKKLKNIF